MYIATYKIDGKERKVFFHTLKNARKFGRITRQNGFKDIKIRSEKTKREISIF